MQMNFEDGRLVFTYDEDGSRWVFHGFVIKGNLHFMMLSELDETKSISQTTKNEIDIYLAERDYMELRKEVENFIPPQRVGYLSQQDPVQSKLDSFLQIQREC